MTASPQPGTWHGLRSVTLDSGELQVTYVPDRGAKIVSLMSDGYEWLIQPVLPLPPAPRYGDPFTQAGVFGWDECAPSVDSCVLTDGSLIPDHGDAWSALWMDDGAGGSWVDGRALDYRLHRRLAVDGRTLTIAYRVEGRGESSPFLWAAHPLFRAPPGTEVRLGHDDIAMLDVTSASPGDTKWDGGRFGIDAVALGEYAKFYLPSESQCDDVRLAHPGGRFLRMRWNGDAPAYFGIFLDNGRFCPEPAIALEPTTGWYDALDRAQALGRVSWVSAVREALSWQVSLDVD